MSGVSACLVDPRHPIRRVEESQLCSLNSTLFPYCSLYAYRGFINNSDINSSHQIIPLETSSSPPSCHPSIPFVLEEEAAVWLDEVLREVRFRC